VYWIELSGYLASLLVFTSFYMRRMIPLRIVAIASNIAFIVFGYGTGTWPVLILHTVLLPLNLWRTVEMRRLTRRVEAASKGALSLDWLKPFMRSVHYRNGQQLFAKGDLADRMFFVVDGQIGLEEIGVRIGPGEIFGEIALFSTDRRRTMTARCVGDTELLWIGEAELQQLCYQNPAMAFHLLRLITNRLMSNMARVEATANGSATVSR
jgi:CRP/FNR family transcriptional regulator, cyclic AMP receptor protein